jgi:hypothetical protein
MNLHRGEGRKNLLEELGSVENLFCRREGVVGCVGRHDEMR